MGDAQIFQIFRSHLRILDSRLVTWSKFHNEDSQIRVVGTTVKNFVTTATWFPGFVHPCFNAWFYEFCITGWFPAEPPTQTHFYGMNMVTQTFINMCKFGSMNGHLVCPDGKRPLKTHRQRCEKNNKREDDYLLRYYAVQTGKKTYQRFGGNCNLLHKCFFYPQQDGSRYFQNVSKFISNSVALHVLRQ